MALDRKSCAGLAASACLIASLMTSEGFEPRAKAPIPGDVPTYGYGSTQHEDGSPVRENEVITKPEARRLLEIKVKTKYEAELHRCAGDTPMLQREWDALDDLAYNTGSGVPCRYIVPLFKAGSYDGGCRKILDIDGLQGVHCRQHLEKPGCKGILNRRQKQYNMCIGASNVP